MSKSKKNIAPVAPAAPVAEIDAVRAERDRALGTIAFWEASDAAALQRIDDAIAARRAALAARAERLLGYAEAPSDAAIAAQIWGEVAAEVAALAVVAADPTRDGVHALRKARHRLTALQLQLAVVTRG
jgi:hypothetical protein